MKIIFIEWNSFGKEDIVEGLRNLGHDVTIFKYPDFTHREVSPTAEAFNNTIDRVKPDLVFSSNYSPVVSNVCQKHSVPYASWVYDSPLVKIYSATILNSCNYVFLFDSEDYQTFRNSGINNVYYMPLAANTRRLDAMIPDASHHREYDCDIAFVGSMYDEGKDYFDTLKDISEYSHGYLDAIMKAQSMVSGYSFIEPLLKGEVLDEIRRVSPYEPYPDGAETDTYVYSRYFIERKITQRERKSILAALSENFNVNLYTQNPTPYLPRINNRGIVNPHDTQPYVFKCSKINLNITLRSIHTGIPLRAMDIMGAGGFLMTNFQSDFLMHFEPDVDYVYYEDEKDLIDKCRFYLENDTARKAIAGNGYNKVKECFSFEAILSNIIETIFQTSNP